MVEDLPDKSRASLADTVLRIVQRMRGGGAAQGASDADVAWVEQELRALCSTSPVFLEGIETLCRRYNGQPGNIESFDKLHGLLRRQHFQLAFWRVALEEINYRRFFNVSELISLRMEDPDVFQAYHRLVLSLLRSGQVTGLRIDHPDGLWDPRQYFRRLQGSFASGPGDAANVGAGHGVALAGAVAQPADVREFMGPAPPLYIVAEKILSKGENLRDDWPVHGTTGYDFLNQVNGLFVDGANAVAMDQTYREFSGNSLNLAESIYAGKKRMLQESFVPELNALGHRLKWLAAQSRRAQDFTQMQLRAALGEIIASFPVYRTYVTENCQDVAPDERHYVEHAIAEVRQRNPAISHDLLDFIEQLLLLRPDSDFGEEARHKARHFVLRFQQLTGPVTAKGVEDTAFYNYNRLISLNEVGGDPEQFGLSVEAWHEYNRTQAQSWPWSLLATSTHDTKRGEDVRARINVLSEIPLEWRGAVQRWSRLNADRRAFVNGEPAPHPNDEYLLYQTLIGSWPSSALESRSERYRERIAGFMTKAIREAKCRSSWNDPHPAYEEAVTRFVAQILDPGISGAFLGDFIELQRKVAFLGQFNSLSQLVLKCASPGVADFYQGTELWDLNLVDPDNRQAVDYELRRRLLDALRKRVNEAGSDRSSLIRELLEQGPDGRIKLFVTWQSLELRRRYRDVFLSGEYLPIPVTGEQHQHVCAFARRWQDQVVLAVVPRLVAGLTRGKEQSPIGEIWRGTSLHLSGLGLEHSFRNIFTGESVAVKPGTNSELSVEYLLGKFPVALLERHQG
jgi:(1->4)-alpha-D-glucan 1-alpha-D-glucosylmutase